LKYARKHNENSDDLGKRIRCRRSDEEYPWPPGKAPWALERGGTGIPPDGARENWGKNQHYRQEEDVKPVVVGRVFANGDRKEKRGGLPSLETLQAPQNEEEAIKMIQLGEKMLNMGFEFSGSRLNHNEKSILGSCLSTIVTKILDKRGMQPARSSGHHSPPRVRRQSENMPTAQKRPRQRNSRSPSPPIVKRERRSPSIREDRQYRERDRRESDRRDGERSSSYRNGSSRGYERYDERRHGEHDDRGYQDYSGHDRNGYSERSSHDRDYGRRYSRDY